MLPTASHRTPRETTPASTEAALHSDPWQLVGTEFDGGIRVESVIGVGGFGTVYRGYHRHFRAPVALKVLRCPDELTAIQRQDLLERFEQETVVLFRLSRLTLDVASCLAAGTFISATGNKTPYIVQEWLNGPSLDQWLKQDGQRRQVSLLEALEVLEGCARALAVAHEQWIVHRDIKPSNVLITTRDGRPRAKLLDFGIAKMLQNERAGARAGGNAGKTSGLRLLSVEYAAPEQWDESLGEPSPQTDLFSLALVLVEMLCGRTALSGTSPNALMFGALNPTQRPTPRSRGVEIPDEIEVLFSSALAVAPAERPAELKEWWSALRSAAERHREWSSRVAPVTAVAEPASPVDGPAPASEASEAAGSDSFAGPASEQPKNTKDPSDERAGVHDVAPSLVAPRLALGTEHVTSAFYEDGDALTREAERQRRRRWGLIATGVAVGLGSMLSGAALFLSHRSSAELWSARSALMPGATLEHTAHVEEPQAPSSNAAVSGPSPVAEGLGVASGLALTSALTSTPANAAEGVLRETGGHAQASALVENADAPAENAVAPAEASAPSNALNLPPPPGRAGGNDAVARNSEVPLRAASVPREKPLGEQRTKSPSLAPRTGELRLNSIPPSAIVIDGHPIGATPKTNVHLSPGSHNVTFVHPELGKRKLMVLVESGKTQTLSVKF